VKANKQVNKNQQITALRNGRTKILSAVSSLPVEKQDEVFLGVWSAKDLLAHLVGWDFTNLQAIEEILTDQVPNFYNYHDQDWAYYNARLVDEYKQEDFGETLRSVQESLNTLIDFLERLPAEEFERDRGLRYRGYKVTIARLLQAEIDDEKMHLEQIHEFTGK
jgi:hypothetical protein